LAATLERLRLHSEVQAVVPNVRLQRLQNATTTANPTPFFPNDTQFQQQWSLQLPSSVAAGLNMPTAWGRWGHLNKSSTPVTIAVVDTGVRFDHPDLSGRLLSGYDFVSELEYANDGNGRDSDPSDPGDWVTRTETLTSTFKGCDIENSTWHGTGIAGLIAASHSNGLGISGVYPQGQILPVRVAGKCGASLSDLLDGVRWAAGLPVAGVPGNPHPARVINLSYGGSSACDGAYQTTIDEVRAVGALVVVAAGNNSSTLTRPADCQGVIAVTATRKDGAKADYASFGPLVALAAPGGSGSYQDNDYGLLTTFDMGHQGPAGATYKELTGTSFAAPLAASVAGMMLAVNPNLNVADLDRLLRQAVRPHVNSTLLSTCQPDRFSQGVCHCTTNTCGSGLLDADKALQLVSASTTNLPTSPPTSSSPVDTNNDNGGGGHSSLWWGALLWAWLLTLKWQGLGRKVDD
jgi:serine protease